MLNLDNPNFEKPSAILRENSRFLVEQNRFTGPKSYDGFVGGPWPMTGNTVPLPWTALITTPWSTVRPAVKKRDVSSCPPSECWALQGKV